MIAADLAHVIWGYGAGRDDYELFAPSLALFGVGLVFFTVHYLMLRGFYALERTRTVFWIQCAVAATNIAAAVVLVGARPTPRTPRRRWCSPTPRRTPSARCVSYLVLRASARRPGAPRGWCGSWSGC